MTVAEFFEEFGYTPVGPLAEGHYELIIEAKSDREGSKHRPTSVRFDHSDQRAVVETEEEEEGP